MFVRERGKRFEHVYVILICLYVCKERREGEGRGQMERSCVKQREFTCK